jgi:NAD(P)-dependent dehydrogenase (short-subunit alcohol dehydrogenase family)
MKGSNMDLSGKHAIVTGASSGIGRAIAKLFAERCARVAVHYNTNKAGAEDTFELLSGSGHLLIAADLTDPDEVAHLVSTVIESFNGIDILVNNAGVYREHRISEVAYNNWQAAWDTVMKTNLFGPANMIYHVSRQMSKQGGGKIINISSRGAFRGEPEAPAYGASKAGLNSLSQSMAKALGGMGIHVYSVAPGFVETEMAAPRMTGERGETIRSESPLGRVARPEEIAHTVLFLASEGSEFLTGSILDVNGASYLRT